MVDSTAVPTGLASLLASKDTAPAPAPKSPPISKGRIVMYQLSASDAKKIMESRAMHREQAPHIQAAAPKTGNSAEAGNTYPMLVVECWASTDGCCNGRVMLDGTDDLWATSVHEGTEPGTWAWPARG